jgi:biotin carboxyl carrier protein
MKLRITVDTQSFEVEVGDLTARPIMVMVDGEPFEVWTEESGAVERVSPAQPKAASTSAATAVSSQPRPGAPLAESGRSVPAPIPGVILSIAVKEGDEVQYGQELCVLEAMKMKNIIRANRGGKVRSIKVAPGEQVRHGQILLEFAD